MRKSVQSLFAFLAITMISLVSCDKSIETMDTHGELQFNSESLTKAGFEEFQVTHSDVEGLLRNLYPNEGQFEIDAYPNDDNPIMYFVNHDCGWNIISGDKRTPPVLAYNDSGYIDRTILENPGVKFWIGSMSESMMKIGKAGPEVESNLSFWDELEHRHEGEDSTNPIQKLIHMNWGRDGSGDGWYAFPDDWGYGNGDFSYSVRMLHNIRVIE